MASEVSICNRALQIIGADSITALTDNNDRARAMRTAYEPVRDAELHRRRWRFALKRASLAALSDAPASDYARQFQLPGDCLRVIAGADLVPVPNEADYRTGIGALWSREGDRLLTNLSAPLRIRYIARIVDTSLFDPSFAEALAARLAMEVCERLTQSSTKKAEARVHYRQALVEAARANAIENAPEAAGDDSWVTARLG